MGYSGNVVQTKTATGIARRTQPGVHALSATLLPAALLPGC
jgi:hypothetical protein